VTVLVGFGVFVGVEVGAVVGVSVAVGVGVDVAVGMGVSVAVGVAVGCAVGVGEASIATGVAAGADPQAANNRRLSPMEIPVSSTDLIVLYSYVYRAPDAAS